MADQNYQDKKYLDIKMGKYELFFKKPYEILYNVNDFMIALWFFIGSFLFFDEALKDAGIWMFVIGSGQLGMRPLIRIIHRIHLKNYVKKREFKGQNER